MKWYHWLGIGTGVLVISSYVNRKRVMNDLSKIRLGEFFTLDEFVKTGTGIDNIPTEDAIQRLKLLVLNVLDPLRKAVGKPVHVTSGYRTPLVNANVPGSSTTSQHMKGEAADIVIDGMSVQDVVNKIRSLKLPYDQLIDEQRGDARWTHVSHAAYGSQRVMWLTRRDPGEGRPKEYELVKYGYA